MSLKDVPVGPWQFDLATGSSGPEDARMPVEARISASAPAFIMAAAGRGTFDALLADGTLSVEGDEALARDVLQVVRVL